MSGSLQSISSSSNPLFRSLLSMAERASARRESGLALIEGEYLLGTWLDHAPHQLREVFIRSRSVLSPSTARVLELPGIQAYELSEPLFRRVSSLENSPGPVALIRIPIAAEAPSFDGDAIFLDRIQDPGNVGTILRSAVAFEVQTVIAAPGSVDLWSPKVLRSAMGAHPLLRIIEQCPIEQLIERARVPLCATSSHGGASIRAVDLRAPRLWLFGAEGGGIGQEALRHPLVQWFRIEQTPTMESLNVGVAASICLYEQYQQRMRVAGSGVPPG
jgi:TrmH family RNA methyltransferase